MENIWNSIQDWAAIYGLSVVGAILILIVGRIASGWVRKVVVKLLEKGKLEPTIVGFLSNIVYALFITFVFLMAISQLGVETTALIAVIGAVGFAIGFALKDSLSHLASGVLILVNKPFTLGDFVEAGGTAGSILEIRLFTTKLKTPDNRIIYVPNSNITSENITNYTAEATRRVDMEFGIGYSDDIDKAKDIILRLLSNDERVLKDPAPQIVVGSLGDSSVNIKVRPWTKKEDYWGFYFDMHENLKKRFDEEGVSIPFPQRDVHLFQQSN